jgi:hypothetical protein
VTFWLWGSTISTTRCCEASALGAARVYVDVLFIAAALGALSR